MGIDVASMGPKFVPPGHGRGRIFNVGGQSGDLGGKEKSILLNIKRVRKLKY